MISECLLFWMFVHIFHMCVQAPFDQTQCAFDVFSSFLWWHLYNMYLSLGCVLSWCDVPCALCHYICVDRCCNQTFSLRMYQYVIIYCSLVCCFKLEFLTVEEKPIVFDFNISAVILNWILVWTKNWFFLWVSWDYLYHNSCNHKPQIRKLCSGIWT